MRVEHELNGYLVKNATPPLALQQAIAVCKVKVCGAGMKDRGCGCVKETVIDISKREREKERADALKDAVVAVAVMGLRQRTDLVFSNTRVGESD